MICTYGGRTVLPWQPFSRWPVSFQIAVIISIISRALCDQRLARTWDSAEGMTDWGLPSTTHTSISSFVPACFSPPACAELAFSPARLFGNNKALAVLIFSPSSCQHMHWMNLPRFQRLPFTWLLCFMLRGLLFTALCKWRKTQWNSSRHPLQTYLTLFRGFKDPPEVNTHMVERLVPEQEGKTLWQPLLCTPPLLTRDFFLVEVEISKYKSALQRAAMGPFSTHWTSSCKWLTLSYWITELVLFPWF